MQIRSLWLYRLSYTYLLLPFILFCLGWLRLVIAIPVAIVMLWVLWRLWSPKSPEFGQEILRLGIPAILTTGLWVFLSGVGGYAFQNWDHHWRNAVLRDLITYDWPVVYAAPDRGPIAMLVYYVGYWLPAALVGKMLGWQAANAFLFFWTWLGVLLVVVHLGFILKTSSFKALLLLVIFSGMDALGAVSFAKEYPTLWLPLQHLEIWSGNLQYSSFTTQLFWVFNQAVPAWLCIAMFVTLSRGALKSLISRKGDSLQPDSGRASLPTPALTGDARDEQVAHIVPMSFRENDLPGQMAFIWALCFFFAPLASLGLLPYLIIEWFQQTRVTIKKPLQGIRLNLLFTSMLIFIISYLFFSSNTAAQERGIQALALKDVIIFFLLEGGILWLLLASNHWRNPRWMLTGILLFITPFIQLGSGRDFVMRASIAPLFYLMLWSGEVLTTRTRRYEDTEKKKSFVPLWLSDFVVNDSQSSRWARIALLICLCIGALTPLYEINRSLYRTYEYYFLLRDEQRVQPSSEPATHLEQGGAPELEHPGSLVADNIQTLTFMDDKLTKNFVANVRQSLYYRYIAPR